MREMEFRRALSDRIGERSVDSYVAYCRRVERELGLELDTCDLTDSGMAILGSRLRAAGVPDNSLRNCLSAVRAYRGIDANQLDAAAPRTGEAASHGMIITRAQRLAWAANTAGSPFNRWLDVRVRDDAGQLDLERLHALALEYGIDKRKEYAPLNPGQQRMNIGNLLRRLVPSSAYDDENAQAPVAGRPRPGDPEAEPPAVDLAPAVTSPVRKEVRDSSTSGLLALYGEILDELRDRGIVRTGNSPVGDYAELLFSRAFNWTLEPNSSSGHDASDAQGLRYQIKGRRLGTSTASRQLSAIRRLNDQTFDYLAAVLFDPSFKVTRAILIPHDLVVRRARRVEHTNSWTFILDDKVWRESGVRDVTAEIAVTASGI